MEVHLFSLSLPWSYNSMVSTFDYDIIISGLDRSGIGYINKHRQYI